MKDIELKSLDLNLLKVFLAVFEEGSVTAAGERLGFAQSSISHALRRLRMSFREPLFVRTTSGMQPTSLALRIHEPIASALASLENVFQESSKFDPQSSTRTFNVIMTDVGEMIFLPRLVSHLRQNGWPIRIKSLQLPRAQYRETLERGEADLALGQLPSGHTDFVQTHLFDEAFSCYVRSGHALAGGMTMQQFLNAEHLIVGPPAFAETAIRKALGPKAGNRNIGVVVRHYLSAPFILEQTDMVACLPRTVSQYFKRFGTITEIVPPVPIPPIVMRAFWHERTNLDDGCKWLRREISRLFRVEDGTA